MNFRKKLRVAFICQPIYFRMHYGNVFDDDWEVEEFPFHFNLSEDGYQDLIDFAADYNFFFRGEHIPNKVLDRLKGKKVALSSEIFPKIINGKIFCTKSSLFRYLDFRQIKRKNFDYVFHYEESSIPFFKADGINISGSFFLPMDMSLAESSQNYRKRWDICFIGRSSSYREQRFMNLKHYFDFFHLAQGLSGKEVVPFIQQSKINLNVHAENEISWEPRVQFLLSAGAFVLTEKLSPNSVLIPGKDYAEIDPSVSIVEQTRYWLENEEKRKEISRQGFETVKKKLNSRICFPQLISDIELGKYPAFKPSRGSFLLGAVNYQRQYMGRASVFSDLHSNLIGKTLYMMAP